MWGENLDVFHYVMLYNENQQQMPKPPDVDDGIVRETYKIEELGGRKKIRLLGSGPILRYVGKQPRNYSVNTGYHQRFGPLPPTENFAGKVLSMKDQDA